MQHHTTTVFLLTFLGGLNLVASYWEGGAPLLTCMFMIPDRRQPSEQSRAPYEFDIADNTRFKDGDYIKGMRWGLYLGHGDYIKGVRWDNTLRV
jgi:hypothetical protein